MSQQYFHFKTSQGPGHDSERRKLGAVRVETEGHRAHIEPHVAKVVKKYLETLKWEVLPHPPYSSDIAPSDFHLFRSIAHGLADQHFQSFEELEKWIASWIASKEDSFFRAGIRKLPERWEKVVASDGQYFE